MNSQPNVWDRYGKSIVAFVYVVASVAIPQLSGDHRLDASEGIVVALAIGNNLLVYIVPLVPSFKSLKTVVTAVLGGLAIAQIAIVDGVDSNDAFLIVSTILAGLGVAIAPAISTFKASVLDDAHVVDDQVVTRVGTGLDT